MIRALATAALLALATSATAQTALSLGTGSFDSGQPVEVSADELAVNQQAGNAVFKGNVIVVQGEVRLSAGQVEVIYATEGDNNPTGISRLVASGGVTFVTPTEAAEAQNAVYSVAAGDVVLTGNVLLTQGANALAGEKLTVDLATGVGRMEGRVRTVFGGGNN